MAPHPAPRIIQTGILGLDWASADRAKKQTSIVRYRLNKCDKRDKGKYSGRRMTVRLTISYSLVSNRSSKTSVEEP